MVDNLRIALFSTFFCIVLLLCGFGFAQTSLGVVGGAIFMSIYALLRVWGNHPDEWYGWNGIPTLGLGALWLFCWGMDVTFPAHPLKSMLFVSAVFAVMCYLFRVIVHRLRRNKSEADPHRRKSDHDHDHDHGHGH